MKDFTITNFLNNWTIERISEPTSQYTFEWSSPRDIVRTSCLDEIFGKNLRYFKDFCKQNPFFHSRALSIFMTSSRNPQFQEIKTHMSSKRFLINCIADVLLSIISFFVSVARCAIFLCVHIRLHFVFFHSGFFWISTTNEILMARSG